MVVTYLEKIRDKYNNQKVEIRSRLAELLKNRKENEEFIKVLESSEDTNFELFSPREINSFNKKKILELKDFQMKIDLELENLESELQIVDSELEELNEVLKVARENYTKHTTTYCG